MANNTHGNRNEYNIEQALNNKCYKELTPVLRSFIKDIYPQIKENTIIKCNTTKGVSKSDLEIYIDDLKINVSVKEGSGNSVHQEKLEPFIDMLTNHFSLSKVTADAFRFFIWGDETLDGSGNPDDRMNSKLLQEKYPDKIHEIQSFFDKNKKELLIRFLMTGRFQIGHIDCQAPKWYTSFHRDKFKHFLIIPLDKVLYSLANYGVFGYYKKLDIYQSLSAPLLVNKIFHPSDTHLLMCH